MKIEERIFKDLKGALERKSYTEVETLRTLLGNISTLKAKLYPKTPSENEISDAIGIKGCSAAVKDIVERYVIPDNKLVLAETYANEIYSKTKGIFDLEDFIDLVKELALKKQNEHIS